jgi:hypothetical protein
MARLAPCAIGVTVHTGWGAALVAAGSLRAPSALAREEVELLGDEERFVFHRAAEMPRARAAQSVARAKKESTARAAAAVGRLVDAARAAGGDVVGCAVVANAGAMPASIDDIVAAHPRIHAAEGLFYRDVFRDAAGERGLRVRVAPPKELDAAAAEAMRIDVAEIARLLSEAGRAIGRPWGRDQKAAALAAWALLASGA